MISVLNMNLQSQFSLISLIVRHLFRLCIQHIMVIRSCLLLFDSSHYITHPKHISKYNDTCCRTSFATIQKMGHESFIKNIVNTFILYIILTQISLTSSYSIINAFPGIMLLPDTMYDVRQHHKIDAR